MTAISPVSLPNLYDLDSSAARMASHASLAGATDIERDLSAVQPSRVLPEGAVVNQPIMRYTTGQLEMRPVDRADAALMAITEPDTFRQFVQALATDGNWREILQPFTQRLQQHPEWLEDRYRLPAADILRRSSYLMDLGVLVELGLADRF